MFDAKALSKRIKEAREELGLSPKELAVLSGVGNSYRSEIEIRKKINIGVEVLFSLATALKISPAYWSGRTEWKFSNPTYRRIGCFLSAHVTDMRYPVDQVRRLLS